MAAHTSATGALVNAVLELIERDAFMIHWMHRLTPPRFAEASVVDATTRGLMHHVRDVGYALHLLDATTDLGVPVALAIAIRSDGLAPALLLGAGAALSAADAVDHAVAELYAATLAPQADWEAGEPMLEHEIQDLADHGRAYLHPTGSKHAAFLVASAEERAIAPDPCGSLDPLFTLDALVATLAAHGHSVSALYITSPDVRSSGIAVVRQVVPGLQPLGAGKRVRLGGTRLYQAPRNMGSIGAATDESGLNRVPHCFP